MTVHLVGAGPGSPDLLTIRAARLLGEADVVIHDRLIGDGIMQMVAPWAERIDVGKDPYGRSVPQTEINRLLIEHGRARGRIVRLKGGDPFVFGRGGEEAIALAEAGIACEIVPGITSAIAGPAAAGIPVTHRGLSSGFTVITGHQNPGNSQRLDWDAVAKLGTTLVVLMGASRASEIRARLLDGGAPADTPVAIVTRATWADQSTVRCVLSELGDTVVENPSIIVLGPAAALELATVANTAAQVEAPQHTSALGVLDSEGANPWQ